MSPRPSSSTMMKDADRFRLLGKYRTPQFHIGQRVICLVRGEMMVTGMTDAPIPWPVGKRDRGRRSLIVCKELALAVRRESNKAICHWWGVSDTVVSKWRWALRMVDITEATRTQGQRQPPSELH